MIILIVNDIEQSLRGFLKRWFIEPKKNILVSSINNRVFSNIKKKIGNDLKFNAIIIESDNSIQGFNIYTIGDTKRRKHAKISGIDLIYIQNNHNI